MYKVSFGMARCWNEEETRKNTRHRFFNNEKKAGDFLDRLNKFTFKDKTLKDFKLIAWSEIYKNYKT
tara:strand:- start:137 stop:337 length:201 start_codon:yes stop_codon:yes gene_type:complete